MKSKKRPTLLEIQNRIILPHLHGIYAQQWIIDQCPNWKEYKNFIYKLSKEKIQTWLGLGLWGLGLGLAKPEPFNLHFNILIILFIKFI